MPHNSHIRQHALLSCTRIRALRQVGGWVGGWVGSHHLLHHQRPTIASPIPHRHPAPQRRRPRTSITPAPHHTTSPTPSCPSYDFRAVAVVVARVLLGGASAVSLAGMSYVATHVPKVGLAATHARTLGRPHSHARTPVRALARVPAHIRTFSLAHSHAFARPRSRARSHSHALTHAFARPHTLARACSDARHSHTPARIRTPSLVVTRIHSHAPLAPSHSPPTRSLPPSLPSEPSH